MCTWVQPFREQFSVISPKPRERTFDPAVLSFGLQEGHRQAHHAAVTDGEILSGDTG